MDKIDLIIDALENWQHSCLELGRCSSELGLATKALAAARELRELKPVAWAAQSIYGGFEGLSFEKQLRFDTPLYALDGVENV